MSFEQPAFETLPLRVTDVKRFSEVDGQIKCDNGQWYTFSDIKNNFDNNGLDLPYVGFKIVLQFDERSNLINWRSW